MGKCTSRYLFFFRYPPPPPPRVQHVHVSHFVNHAGLRQRRAVKLKLTLPVIKNPSNVGYLTIARVGYEMVNSQRGA